MPLGKLWSLVNMEGQIFLKFNTEIKSEFGYITGVRPHGEKDNQIKMKFSLLDRPRALALSSFSWDDNVFSRLFKSCGGSDGFMNIWSQNNPAQSDSINSSPSQLSPQQNSRKRPASKLLGLVPVSKAARTADTQNEVMENNQDDAGEIVNNKEIEKYFIGFYMLPINSLIEPPDPVLVRKTSRTFIDSLKQEMMHNPISDVQPILCMVCLKEGDEFAEKYKEAYKYQTIGGNHSRVAFQELVQDHPKLAQNRNYTHRLCSVYSILPTNLALCLASKHNRASSFCHEMTTWDKIVMCRRLLYDIAGQVNTGEIEPPDKPPAWKKSCSVILLQTVDQLDDAMIFNLSSLPLDSFHLLTNIYTLYADGKLKGQHIPRSKKGTMAKPPDLKGSKFKGLRGIDSSHVFRLLGEVEGRKITLKELATECTSIKMLLKVQAAFVKGTNSKDWEDAIKKYPDFCTSEQLEPFTKLSFSSNTLPDQFLRFCQRATKPSRPATASSHSTDDVFVSSTSNKTSSCIFWKQKCLEVTPATVKSVYEHMDLEFSGFSLTIVDTPVLQSESIQFVKEFRLMIRTLNYYVSLQDFTVIFQTPLCCLGEIANSLDNDDNIQLGVCNFYNSKTGNKAGSFSELEENVSGLVIIRCGNKSPLPRNEGNCFSFMEDTINKQGKPFLFCQKLIDLYTNKGEWILDAHSGVGSCAVAAVKSERNCLSLESDPQLFFQSKARLVNMESMPAEKENEVDEVDDHTHEQDFMEHDAHDNEN